MRKFLIIAILFGVMVALLAFDFGVNPLPFEPKTLAATGFILLAAYTIGEVVQRFGPPKVVGYILTGVLFGPSLTEVVFGKDAQALFSLDVINDLSLVNALALGLIGLTAGGELLVGQLKKDAKAIGGVVGAQTLIVFLCVGSAVCILGLVYPQALPFLPTEFGASWIAAAMLFGALAVGTSPATTLAVIAETRAKGPLKNLTLGLIIAKDVTTVTFYLLMLAFATVLATGKPFQLEVLVHIAEELGYAILLGAGLGLVFWIYLRWVKAEVMLFTIAVVFAGNWLAQTFHAEALLLFIAAGFTVAHGDQLYDWLTRTWRARKSVVEDDTHHLHHGHGDGHGDDHHGDHHHDVGHEMIEELERIALPTFVVFFTIAAAKLDLLALPKFWIIASIYVVVRAISITAATQLGVRFVGADEHIRKHLWLGMFAQGGVTLTISRLVSGKGVSWGDEFATIIMATLLVNIVAGPILLKLGLNRAGETAKPDERDDHADDAPRPEDAGAPLPAVLALDFPEPHFESAALNDHMERLRDRLARLAQSTNDDFLDARHLAQHDLLVRTRDLLLEVTHDTLGTFQALAERAQDPQDPDADNPDAPWRDREHLKNILRASRSTVAARLQRLVADHGAVMHAQQPVEHQIHHLVERIEDIVLDEQGHLDVHQEDLHFLPLPGDSLYVRSVKALKRVGRVAGGFRMREVPMHRLARFYIEMPTPQNFIDTTRYLGAQQRLVWHHIRSLYTVAEELHNDALAFLDQSTAAPVSQSPIVDLDASDDAQDKPYAQLSFEHLKALSNAPAEPPPAGDDAAPEASKDAPDDAEKDAPDDAEAVEAEAVDTSDSAETPESDDANADDASAEDTPEATDNAAESTPADDANLASTGDPEDTSPKDADDPAHALAQPVPAPTALAQPITAPQPPSNTSPSGLGLTLAGRPPRGATLGLLVDRFAAGIHRIDSSQDPKQLGQYQRSLRAVERSHEDAETHIKNALAKPYSDLLEATARAGTFELPERAFNPSKRFDLYTRARETLADTFKRQRALSSGALNRFELTLEMAHIHLRLRHIIHTSLDAVHERLLTPLSSTPRAFAEHIAASRERLAEVLQRGAEPHVLIEHIKRERASLIEYQTRHAQHELDEIRQSRRLDEILDQLRDQLTQLAASPTLDVLIASEDELNRLPRKDLDALDTLAIPLAQLLHEALSREVAVRLSDADMRMHILVDRASADFTEIGRILKFNLDAASNEVRAYIDPNRPQPQNRPLAQSDDLKPKLNLDPAGLVTDTGIALPREFAIDGLERAQERALALAAHIDEVSVAIDSLLRDETVRQVRKVSDLVSHGSHSAIRDFLTALDKDATGAIDLNPDAQPEGQGLSGWLRSTYYRWFVRDRDEVLDDLRDQLGLEGESERIPLHRQLEHLDARLSAWGGDNLPHTYQRLFSPNATEVADFFVSRPEVMRFFNEAVEQWLKNHHTSVAIIGEPGSGRQSFIEELLRGRLDGMPVIRRHLTHTINSPEDLAAEISSLTGGPVTRDMNRLRARLSHQNERVVIILEDAENLFLRSLKGMDTIQRFMHLLSETGQNILWVLTMDLHAWRYLETMTHIRQRFTHPLLLRPLTRAELQEMILSRHRVGGFNLLYTNQAQGLQQFRMLLAQLQKRHEERQLILQDAFFDQLYHHSQGNPLLAIYYWLQSVQLAPDDEETLRVVPIEPIEVPFLAQLQTETMMTLANIILHDGLTVREFAQVFRVPEAQAQTALRYLLHLRLVYIEPGNEDRFKLNRVLYLTVAETLRQRNLL